MRSNTFTMQHSTCQDFHARQYDATVPAFTSIDPMAEKYYGISSYAYCAGDPVNCVDKDGKKVIFINGFSTNNKELENSSYWKDSHAFDKMRKIDKFYSKSSPVFLDGSIGSILTMGYSLDCNRRYRKGLEKGNEMAKDIISSLHRCKCTGRSGNYVENLYIVTHSMGAAYAKGFVTSIMKYLKDNNITGVKIYEIDFAPHQPKKQKAVEGVKTIQIYHDDDDVVDNSLFDSEQGEIDGVDKTIGQIDDEDEGHGHSINSFNESWNCLINYLNELEKKEQHSSTNN